MKKTSAEILEMRALQAVNKAKNVFSWNMDITFAKLMLPCVKAYYKKAEKTIDTSYICMPLFLRNKMMDREGCKSKWFLKIKKYYHKKYIKHMKDFIDALEDVLIEATDKWEKKWNMKPFKKIEYDLKVILYPSNTNPNIGKFCINLSHSQTKLLYPKNVLTYSH